MFMWSRAKSIFLGLIVGLLFQPTESLSIIGRRDFFIKSVSSVQAASFVAINSEALQPSYVLENDEYSKPTTSYQKFIYSENWIGTALPKMSLEQAAVMGRTNDFDMGRWPDPILRESANRINSRMIGSDTLKLVANKLRRTARINQAVGLAAQQCGVDGSLIFLDDLSVNTMYRKSGKFVGKDIDSGGLFLCNPRIIQRSPEVDMNVWTEECLVLPPTFTATTLRDSSITVQYEDLDGETNVKTLKGELARALQHEMDHDRGILITDHVDLNELESSMMRQIEKDGHEKRMALAYSRYIDAPTNIYSQKPSFVESASAAEVPNESSSTAITSKPNDDSDDKSQVTECDEVCKANRRKIIEERRAMMRQSKSSTSRRETMELSRQRATLYNTQYKGL